MSHITLARRAARAANPGGRIRGIVTGIEHICGERWLRVVFEPHRTGERIRRYRSLSASWTKGAWEVGGLGTGLEVAPPWRSFEGGLPPLESEIQDLWYDPDLPDETLLAIVDLVRDRIPDGERIWTIELFGDFRYELEAQLGRPRVPGVDVYEVSTIRGCSGTDYRVEHEDGRWTVEETGEWIS